MSYIGIMAALATPRCLRRLRRDLAMVGPKWGPSVFAVRGDLPSENIVSETIDSALGGSEERAPVFENPPKATEKSATPTDLRVVRFFLLTLGALLVGYAFLGRGFAHLGVPPLYLGEFVLAFGLVATAVAVLRGRLQVPRSWLVIVLVVFMLLGAIDTVPYIPQYGTNALRDATLWGYAIFALFIFALLDRDWVLKLFRLYGRVAILFLLWGPVAWWIFTTYTTPGPFGSSTFFSNVIPNAPGSGIPILFFKSQDMAVHTAGAIAYLVVGTPLVRRIRDFLWRLGAALPAAWLVYVTGSVTRGGLAAVAASVGVLAAVAGRTRNWVPVAAGAVLFAAVLTSGIASPLIPSGQDERSLVNNIGSILGGPSDSQLQGTRNFRLQWWEKIVDYTVRGPYFWTGKGFGVNLADSDGFQVVSDDSLREPHNAHMSVLARMGVPGFLLWVLLQAGFALLLLRALLVHRRAGDSQLAAVAAWILAFWMAIMVNTSFDPYLNGPQGGIWFWALFGLGLVVIRLVPRRQAA